MSEVDFKDSARFFNSRKFYECERLLRKYGVEPPIIGCERYGHARSKYVQPIDPEILEDILTDEWEIVGEIE